MIISIILVYFIILVLYFFVKKKKNTVLLVNNYGEFIIQIIKILSFILSYVIFLRFLNIFRVTKFLDLTKLNISFNFILIILLIFFVKKLLFFSFKISWFKFHYVMMCESNFSKRVNSIYKLFFYNLVYSPAYYTFVYLIYINYCMIVIMVLFFSYDLIYNNFILNYSLWFVKYYSIFRMFYISYDFMFNRQSLVLDYYNYNLMYPGSSKIFKNYAFENEKHFFLIEESKKYSSGIILEQNKYLPKYLGDLSSIKFFRK